MKIKIPSSIVLSFLIIATSAVFALSVIPSMARADDTSGEVTEQCTTVSADRLGKCICSEYTCHTYIHVVGKYNMDMGVSRAGMGCFIGNSQMSVWGHDTSVNNDAGWGDPSNCVSEDL